MVEIYARTGRQVGSGYLVASGLVLTAYHVAHKDVAAPAGTLRIRTLASVLDGRKEWFDAEIVWPCSPPDVERDPGADAALLRVTDPRWEHRGLLPLRWGRVDGGARVDALALGFPDAEKGDDAVRDTMPVRGAVDPYHGMKTGLLTVHVTGAVPRKRGWHGMSGAALFCGPVLTGVLVLDHDITDRADVLRATPVAELLRLPGFRDQLVESGEAVTVEQVTAPEPPAPAPASPAGGLRPFPPVPAPLPPPGFVGRARETDRAVRFVADGRLIPVEGPEHVGKTAFLTHVLRRKEFGNALPRTLPRLFLDLSVAGGRGGYPVSRALSTLLEADLFGLEHYTEESTTSPEAKREYLIDQVLASSVRHHALVAVIDCAMANTSTEHLESDLDALLASPVFSRSVSFLASNTRIEADGHQQLRRMPSIRLGSLAPDEAAALLTSALDDFGIDVDAAEVLAEADDAMVRRPKILLMGAERYAEKDIGDGARADSLVVACELLDACRITITSAFGTAGCRITENGAPGPLASLIVWAMDREVSLPETVLSRAGLTPAMLSALTASGVLGRQVPDDGGTAPADVRYRLGRATQEALRNLVRVALASAEGARCKEVERAVLLECAHDARELDRVLEGGAKALGLAVLAYADMREEEARRLGLARFLEFAHGWLDRALPDGLPRLRKQMQDFVLVDTAALFAGVERAERQEVHPEAGTDISLAPETEALAQLFSAVAELNLIMRDEPSPENNDRFVAAARATSSAIRACTSDIPTQLLRGVDNALYLGARRFGCHAEVVSIREEVVPLLEEQARRRTSGKVGRIVWTVSWILNTVDVRLDMGEEAGEYLRRAGDLLAELPEPDTVRGELTSLALRVRQARARARTTSGEERTAALRTAMELGLTGLSTCAAHLDQIHQVFVWTRRSMETARNYALELRFDDERIALLGAVGRGLEEAYGPQAEWPLTTCLAMTRLLRHVHRRQADPAVTLEGAHSAVGLLLGHEGTLREQAAVGQGSGLVELGQALGFHAWALSENGNRREALTVTLRAERHVEYVVGHSPSAYAYRVWLQLLRQRGDWDGGTGAASGQGAESDFRQAVLRTAQWLREQRTTSRDHALLDLWCIEEKWHRQGRSLYAAAESQSPGKGFRLEDLERVHHERLRYLQGHRKRYGNVLDAFLVEADLEREFRRLLAVHSRTAGNPVDNTAVWAVHRRAEEEWPLSNRRRLARARLHRYTWENAEAVEVLETVVRSSRNGHVRRQAQIAIAESLLLQAQYDLPSGPTRTAALHRAADQLTESLGHRYFRQRVAILRERINLELGEAVDWAATDATFDDLISDGYTTTIGRWLQRQRGVRQDEDAAERSDDDERLSDLLYEDFTNEALIYGLGQLYLRNARVLLAAGSTEAAAEAAKRAYDCFDACRVLLVSWSGEESLVNLFQRAEAVLCAAEALRSPDPFSWRPEKKPSWLHLAVDALQSCSARSVGRFHQICAGEWEAARKLLKTLSVPGQG